MVVLSKKGTRFWLDPSDGKIWRTEVANEMYPTEARTLGDSAMSARSFELGLLFKRDFLVFLVLLK